ncbi:hypothetical protein LBYZC6_17800 [Lacrimispora brassicae]
MLWSSELQQQGIVKFVSNYVESNIELLVDFLFADSRKQGTGIILCALFYCAPCGARF